MTSNAQRGKKNMARSEDSVRYIRALKIATLVEARQYTLHKNRSKVWQFVELQKY